MQDSTTIGQQNGNRSLQYFSTVAANALPVVQLFFTQLPQAITRIFLAPELFTGLSILTLIVSYVIIVAYQANPYASLILPLQGKRRREFGEYQRRSAQASNVLQFVKGEHPSEAKVELYLDEIRESTPPAPLQIGPQNIMSWCVGFVVLSAIVFLLTGATGMADNRVLVGAQSFSYVALIVFSVLVLTVYRRVDSSSKRYELDQIEKSNRAIQLAIQANCFGNIPQVKYISSFDDNEFPSNHHVRVEYGGQQYEIMADMNGRFLKYVFPLDPNPEVDSGQGNSTGQIS